MTDTTALGVVLALVLVASGGATALAPGQAVAAETGQSGNVLVVDDDGDAAYESIQAAVDAAERNDTIRVRPGTYRERVVVDADVRVVAPRGATLDGSAFDEGAGFELAAPAGVTVEGFTVVDFAVGVDAMGSSADWTLRNTTIRNASYIAVAAGGSDGDWRVADVVVERSETGIDAASSSGEWRVTDTVVRDVAEGHGVDAQAASGAWELRNVTVADVGMVGLAASYTTGDWRVANSTIREATVGVGALEATGDWAIHDSAVANASVSERYDFWQPPLAEGVGIHAAGTNGSWTVRSTRLVGHERAAVDATGADPPGDAAGNWWGDADGPDDGDCVGNVTCEDPLSARDGEATTEVTPSATTTTTPPGTTTSPATTAPAASSEADPTSRTVTPTESPTLSPSPSPPSTSANGSGRPGVVALVAGATLVVAVARRIRKGERD